MRKSILIIASIFLVFPCLGQEKKVTKKEDPQLKAIENEMAKVAKKGSSIHFKIKITSKMPIGEELFVANGELWAIGDRKMHFILHIKPGRMMEMTNEIVINPKGAWVKIAPGEVLFCPMDLVDKLKKVQNSRVNVMQMASIMENLDILSGLRAQGFELKWRGQKKLGKIVVDEIVGKRVSKRREGSPFGGLESNIDRCVILVGEKDRVPRRIEFYAGEEQIRRLEFSDVNVGGKIPEDVFNYTPSGNERVIPALKHPLWGPALQEALKALEEKKK